MKDILDTSYINFSTWFGKNYPRYIDFGNFLYKTDRKVYKRYMHNLSSHTFITTGKELTIREWLAEYNTHKRGDGLNQAIIFEALNKYAEEMTK